MLGPAKNRVKTIGERDGSLAEAGLAPAKQAARQPNNQGVGEPYAVQRVSRYGSSVSIPAISPSGL